MTTMRHLSVVAAIASLVPTCTAFTSPVSVVGKRTSALHLWTSESHPIPDDERRRAEFTNLEPIDEPEERRRRLEQELETREQFVEFGDKLWNLRTKMDKLSSRLVRAINEGEETAEEQARAKLRDAEKKDPELVYMLELAEMEDALEAERMDDAAEHREKADAARSCLPHFNLDGLWVGKYGSHGYELINITYVGDTLVAHKVTGDKNVPKGELTFQVDLNPLRFSQAYGKGLNKKPLQPIMLTEKASKKWGTSKLPRYSGLGQVAEEGFRNSQWMEGQLIVIGDEYFSFAWIPIENQIFFGRPSPELALKMLRDSTLLPITSSEQQLIQADTTEEVPATLSDTLEDQKRFAMRCLAKTDEFEDEFDDADAAIGSCIWYEMDAEECYFE